ncbi:hypothetical protein QGM71_20245 [Virgibacillus sp. C22-A2]|uniref:Uncharacterized protein n=1 Tax=Virgibacillus tibetensis TaxID=3042313 RepID=A0ABU6KKP9_9BACI|nr:hypothetical protein [Virgibacillus sp. C22-A2]
MITTTDELFLNCFQLIADQILPGNISVEKRENEFRKEKELVFSSNKEYIIMRYRIPRNEPETVSPSISASEGLKGNEDIVYKMLKAFVNFARKSPFTKIKTRVGHDYRYSFVPKGTDPILDLEDQCLLKVYKQLGFHVEYHYYQKLNGDIVLGYNVEKSVL